MAEKVRTKVVTLSARVALVSGIRKALTDLKKDVEKSFVEDVAAALKQLDGVVQAVVVIDWDMGPQRVLKFFKAVSLRPEREFWQIFLLASEQSEKIIAAGTEYGVSRIHTGDITPAKLSISLDGLIDAISDQPPLVKVMAKIAEAREKGEWEAATKLLESLYQKSPDNKRVVQELSENYLQEGKWKQCHDMLSPLKDNTPMDVRLMHSYGKSLIKLGRHKEAAEALKQAKLVNPYNVERLLSLGNVLLNLDATVEAEENFAEAERLDPGNKAALTGRSTAKLMDGEINEALGIMSNAVSGRELASVFNTAAVLSMRLGRFPKGMNLYDAAEKVLQDQTQIVARVLYNKGLGFYRWKKFDDAKKCFEKAVSLDPEFENAKFNLKAVSGDAVGGAGPMTAVDSEMQQPAELPKDNMDFDDTFGDSFDDDLGDSFADDFGDDDEHI